MNTPPTIKITSEGSQVGVATARLLLQLALEKEGQAAEPIKEEPTPIFLPPIGKGAPPTNVSGLPSPPYESHQEIEHHSQARPEE